MVSYDDLLLEQWKMLEYGSLKSWKVSYQTIKFEITFASYRLILWLQI